MAILWPSRRALAPLPSLPNTASGPRRHGGGPARDDVDVVLVCTPHRPIGRDRGGRGGREARYIEEPMAVTLADCDAIIVPCRDARVLLDVNHVTAIGPRRSPPSASSTTAASASADGPDPQPALPDLMPSTAGRTRPARAARLDMGVHLSDALRWFTGSEVEAILAKVRDSADDLNERRSGPAEVVLRNGVGLQLDQLRDPASGSRLAEPVDVIGSDGIVERTGTARSGSGAARPGRTSSRRRRSRSTRTSTA